MAGFSRALDTVTEDDTTKPGRPRARSPAPPQALLRADRYRVRGVLGEGGMSVVYDAHDTLLGRDVALKELRVGSPQDPDVLVREARALAAVQHPRVVGVFGLHVEPPAPFIVMERVEGETLDRYVRRTRPRLRDRIALLAQLADGIDAIHGARLVHGDVKPSNVLVDRAGCVKITDVGLVALLERMAPGDVLGTPAYMPPERALGAVSTSALAPRADVYSFACVALELLAGVTAFGRGDPERLLRAHAYAPAPRPSEVSGLAPTFDPPFASGLAKRPEQRPESCGALVAALRRASAGTDEDGAPLRILVADDDADQRAQLADVLTLRLRGATIDLAGDGDEALRALHERVAPKVVILDLAMPGVSGIPLVRRVRELVPGAIVIVVTGHGSGPEWSAARALGVHRFYVKPVEGRELARSICELVDGTAAEREG